MAPSATGSVQPLSALVSTGRNIEETSLTAACAVEEVRTGALGHQSSNRTRQAIPAESMAMTRASVMSYNAEAMLPIRCRSLRSASLVRTDGATPGDRSFRRR